MDNGQSVPLTLQLNQVSSASTTLCRLLLAAIVIGLTGCVGTGLYETARTAGQGKAELTGAFTPWERRDSLGWTDFDDRPTPVLAIRGGVLPDLDIGLNLRFMPGIEGCAKYHFLKHPFDMAVALSGAAYGFVAIDAAMGYAAVTTRLIVSNEGPRKLPFMFNAGVTCRNTTGTGENRSWLAVGGVGIPIRFPGVDRFRVMPEISGCFPLKKQQAYNYYNEAALDSGIDLTYDLR